MTDEEKLIARKQLANVGIYKLSDLPAKCNYVSKLPTMALRYLKTIIPLICYNKDCELHTQELKVYTTVYLPLIRATLASRK